MFFNKYYRMFFHVFTILKYSFGWCRRQRQILVHSWILAGRDETRSIARSCKHNNLLRGVSNWKNWISYYNSGKGRFSFIQLPKTVCHPRWLERGWTSTKPFKRGHLIATAPLGQRWVQLISQTILEFLAKRFSLFDCHGWTKSCAKSYLNWIFRKLGTLDVAASLSFFYDVLVGPSLFLHESYWGIFFLSWWLAPEVWLVVTVDDFPDNGGGRHRRFPRG